ncbi:glutamate receptor U1-like [Lineus longissimus]|uniref:glutamate receptor U1-like n=1 Tax=Lineus longissimus TaxID=88925 RepID=UPI002B4FAB06
MRVMGENCTRYTQYELRATLMVGTKMRLGRTAKWNRHDGLQLDSDALFPNSRNGFNGMNFRVTTLPYSYFQQNQSFPDGSFAIVGLVPDIVNILARSLNFTVTWVQPPDGYWGAPVGDGSWNGMIGQVMRGEVDFAAAGHSITAARSAVVDFADAFFFGASIIMVKTPGSLGRLLVYLAPLNTLVWICTIISIPVCSILLWLLMRASPFYSNQDPCFYPESFKLLKFGPCLWYIFGCLWNQGQSTTPRAMSGRLLLTSWWLFVVVILATYSGNLIAFLTVTKVTLPISSLSELAAQNDMTYGTIQGTALWTLLETSKAGAPKRIWNTMDKQNQPDSYSAGKEKVISDNYALLVEKSFFEGVAADNCSFTFVPKEEFYFSSYGIAVGKGSPLTMMLSEGIQAMSESGVLEKLRKDWTPRQRCEGLTYSESKPATLEDTQGAFIVLGIGLAVGSVALLVEVFLKCVLRAIKRKTSTATSLGSKTSRKSNNNVKFKDGRRRSSI